MTTDNLDAVAAAALTAAVLITLWAVHARTYRRTLARVRARRDAYRAEVRQLREERAEARWARHVAEAAEPPIDYTLADRTAYLPAFEGDRLGYDDPRTITARRVTR